MDSRQRILTAAADLFSRHGFRGATTRLIAKRAGVNEVTIFRTFGSKERLIAEAIHAHAAETNQSHLPSEPVNPRMELGEWCAAQLNYLRSTRSLIRTCMGELEERPDFAPDAAHGPSAAGEQLRGYVESLRARGMITREVNMQAAMAMLMGACFADAMGRDMMPQMFPQPAEQAAVEYANLFLSLLGVESVAPATTTSRSVSANNLRRANR